MRPAQEFRFWARRAPTAERISAGVAATLVIALLAWLLVPGSGPKATNLASGGGRTSGELGVVGGGAGGAAGPDSGLGTTGGAAGNAGSSGGAAGAASTSGTAAGTNGSAPGGGLAPGCPSASGITGVSNSQIKIAVTLTNIVGPAANSLFGIASPAEQQSWYEAVLDDINKKGGIASRKIVPTFYPTNPSDQNELQQRCLQIAQSGVFAEVDNGAYAIYPQKHCYAQHGIPFFGGYILFRDEIDQFYPYLFNISEFDTLDRNAVFALKDRGFFNVPPNEKIGFTYRDCDKPLVDKWMTWFQQVGVPSSKLVTYDFGCPAVFASPSDIQAAVLKFKENNVTRLTAHQLVGDFSNFSNVAQQQGFKPQYGLPDESIIDVAYGSQAPNPDNIAGAIAIAQGRSGEERTPGAVPSAGTAKCNAIYQAHGIKPTYQLAPGAGYVCDQLWMFQAAITNAPALHPAALAAGLQRAKSIDFSYPGGPNDFTGTRQTTGGQFWRVAQFMASCKCWQVIDPNFHPSYP